LHKSSPTLANHANIGVLSDGKLKPTGGRETGSNLL
jgi:hypothetical protein